MPGRKGKAQALSPSHPDMGLEVCTCEPTLAPWALEKAQSLRKGPEIR